MKNNERKLNIGGNMILLGFAFNIITSIIFAWNVDGVWINPEPINESEAMCDSISSLLINIGVIVYMLPLFNLYRAKVKQLDNEESTQDIIGS